MNSITDYEYRGFLSSLVHHNGNHWKRQFCVLKEARLYCFPDMNATQAIGKTCDIQFIYNRYSLIDIFNDCCKNNFAGIIYLHGYKIQSTSSASRRHAFELIPLEGAFKHFLFYTETSIDKRRWINSSSCPSKNVLYETIFLFFKNFTTPWSLSTSVTTGK